MKKLFLLLCLICLTTGQANASIIDAPHNETNNIVCVDCHKYSLWWQYSPFLSDSLLRETKTNAICLTCHDDSGSEITEITHSSSAMGSAHRTDLGDWARACVDCHDPHFQNQLNWSQTVPDDDLYLVTGTIVPGSLSVAGSGTSLSPYYSTVEYLDISIKAAWDNATTPWTAKSGTAGRGLILSLPRSNPNNTYEITGVNDGLSQITVKGRLDSSYADSSTQFGLIYGQLIRDQIAVDGQMADVKFFDPKGGFVNIGDNDGICQVCHTNTLHFRNTGEINATGEGYDHTSQVNANCTDCHPHPKAFSHGGGSSSCVQCHGHDAGTIYDADMTKTSSPYVPNADNIASIGAGTYQSHSTHTEIDSDDQRGPGLYCASCHDLNNMPNFKNQDGTGGHTLTETDICNDCHSPGGTYDGVDNPVIGAKANWHDGIYDNNGNLQTDKQKWCAGCHDEVPSVIQGVAAPNVIGDEDAVTADGYVYDNNDTTPGWGFYKTGHGLDNGDTYPASGGLTYGAGKGCGDCHDCSTAHIDGNARTYAAASNNYQVGYRLKSIDGASPLTIPHPQNIDDHDPGLYRLCFSCHDANKYLLKTPNQVSTNFRDDLDLGPWDGGDPPINIHEYHLVLNSIDFDSDWDGSADSEIVCVNCHNVHGSTQLAMVRDGKLVNREPGMSVYYDNALVAPTTYSSSAPSPANVTLNNSTGTMFLATSPANICGNCHGGNYVKWYRTPPTTPIAPSLDWTGESNYITDGVDPESGIGGDYFTFRISYTDANYQIPTTIQVWIDENDNGTYEDTEKYDLQGTDSNDTNVSDGKLYRVIRAIGNAGNDGTLSYRFYASDGTFDATNGATTGDPTDNTANTITVTNNAPVLSWTNEDGYVADGISANSAAAGSTFIFRVKYTDIDNNAPTSVQLWVDKDDDNTSVGDESTELITMNSVDSGDTTYSDGKLYTQDVVINAAGDNTLSYVFTATDGTDVATGVPTSNRTLTVTTTNTAPELDWTGETNYTLDGVSPDSDVPESTFTFQVKYSDSDNNTPSSIQVWIDKNDDGDYLDDQEKIDMTALVDADSDYTDGKLYTKDVTLTVAGDGIMNYRFYAADGTDDAIGIPTADNIVTVLIDAIKVSCQGIGDYDYTSIQAAIDVASNGDTIVVADGTCTESLIIDNKDLTIKSVNGEDVTIIDGDGATTVVTIQNGADSTLNGFRITGGNRTSGYGAGVVIINSSPTISNAIITGNNSQMAAGLYATGSGSTITITDSTVSSNVSSIGFGGIYLDSGISAVITDTTITGNSAPAGGGLYMTTSADASLSITGSTISNHTVTGVGGGISINATGGVVTVAIDDTTITGNSAQRGGALYMTDSGATTTVTINDSTISNNTSSLAGGGFNITAVDTMTISGSTFSNNSGVSAGGLYLSGLTSLTVSDSTIRDNSATSYSGGGMWLSGGTATFERSTISGNSAGQLGGGVYISGVTVPTFTNCMITGNKTTSLAGAGLLFTGVDITANVINSTLSGNWASSANGGAIAVANSASVTLLNSILYGNGGSNGSSEIDGTVSASYSDIQQTGYDGNDNRNTDPIFVSPVNYSSAPTSSGDYHLDLSSPVIDLGTNTGAPVDDIDNNARPIGIHDMGADEVITVANNAPSLSWIGETNYTNDGVNPDLGIDGADFVFMVNYADSDNNPPSSMQIWIDTDDNGTYAENEKYAMTEADTNDTTYSNGKIYTYTQAIAYNGDGLLNYRFYAADGYETASGVPTSNSTLIINTRPTLTWIASGNYTTDGVDPDAAASGTSFDFHVKYTDDNDDAPTSIQVWIDMNDNGDYLDVGEKLTMTEVDSSDTDYTDGKEYSKAQFLNYAGDGIIKYRFYASDGSTATGTPTADSTCTITNSTPVLSWLGSGDYISDGVNPNGASSGSNGFEFQINYNDADNQAPSSIQVWIDADDNATYETDEKHTMTGTDGSDAIYSDGKIYSYTVTNLTRVNDDYLNYRFAGSDGITAAIGTPVSADKLVGVFTSNQAPDLDWTGEANYTTDGVNPDSGVAGDAYTFQLKYTDPENTAPSSIQVWVDLNDNAIEDGGELTTLAEVDGTDTAYDDGKLYSATITLSSVTNPTTNYKFKASDGTNTATGNATTSKTVTIITPIEVCGVDNAATCEFTTIGAAIGAALSTSPCDTRNYIKVCNGTYSENINFSGKAITLFKESTAGTATIQGTGANSPVVTFSGGETANSILDGFIIDNQNNTGSAARGIYIVDSGPVIKNSIIQGNSADSGTDGGGGVYIVNNINIVEPTFDHCTIKTNHATYRSGCGMYIKGTYGGATITSTTIGGPATEDGNKCSTGYGGGIYYIGATNGVLSISDSNIQYNQGLNNGGGILLNTITNTTVISNTTILNNYTQIDNNGYGGGIYAINAPLAITNGSISNNISGANRGGGGLYISGSSATITATTINSNSTGSIGGGGIYFAGTTLDIIKAKIQGNTGIAGGGGGVRIASGTATITNSLITGNRLVNSWNYGGGIKNAGTLNLYFSTIADNYAHDGGGLDCGGTENIYNSIIWGNAASLSNTEIRGTTDTLYLTEFGGDTAFISRSTATSATATIDGDYHLQASSNCIDTSDASNAPTDDLEDNVRPYNIVGKGDGTDDYDKGAYEYRP